MSSEDRAEYDRALEKVRELEATRARCEAAGNPFPRRLNRDLWYWRWKAEEIRMHGHRAHVAEVRESVGGMKQREIRERVLRERAKYNCSLAPTYKGVGARIREMRREKGLTQADLALLSNLSPDTIRELEGGKTRPQNNTMWAITEALEFVGVEDAREQIWGDKV